MRASPPQTPIHIESPPAHPPDGGAERPHLQRPPETSASSRLELAPRRSRRWRLLLLVPIVLTVGTVAAWLGYQAWYDATFFVVTDNAQVTGDLVQVGSLNAGRIVATRVDVGDRVQRDQEIALISIPQQVAMPFGGTTRVEETGGAETRVAVRSPITGIVVARMGNVGATVSAGQPIYTVIEPSRLWVRANIEETRVALVAPGQPAEVFVDALGQSFRGRVVAITPATAATFSLLPSQNVSGNYVRVTQLVPVKVEVETGGAVLPVGTSATVRIRVREAVGGFPWQP